MGCLLLVLLPHDPQTASEARSREPTSPSPAPALGGTGDAPVDTNGAQVSLFVPAPSHPPRPRHLRRLTESSSVSFFFKINNQSGRQTWPPRQQLVRESPKPVLAGGSVVGGTGERLPWRVSPLREASPLDGEPSLWSIFVCSSPQESKLHQSHEKVSDSHLLFPGPHPDPGFQHTLSN